jgi:hypothetical protein
MNAH